LTAQHAPRGVGFELQAQLTQVEDREIEAGKRRSLCDAGDDAETIQMGGQTT
jgi:hypothetical protein